MNYIIELTENTKPFPKTSYYMYEVAGILHETNDKRDAFIFPSIESVNISISYISDDYRDYDYKAIELKV